MALPQPQPSEIVAKVFADSGTRYWSQKPFQHPSYLYQGKVLEFGWLEKSIAVPILVGVGDATGVRSGDCRVRVVDTDHELRDLLGTETLLRRIIQFFRVRPGGSETEFPAIGTYEIADWDSGQDYVEIVGANQFFEWLSKPILPNLINRTNFPAMAAGIDEAFLPIVQGVNRSDSLNPQGKVKLPHIQHTGSPASGDRYGVACHPVSSVVKVYRKLPGEGAFSIVSSGYTVTEEPFTIDGIDFDFTFLDFNTVQAAGTEIRADIDGIDFRGEFGSMPQVSGSPLRNPIDFLINVLYLHIATEVNVPRIDVDSFNTARNQLAGLASSPAGTNYLCDGVVERQITFGEFLSWFCNTFEVYFFENREGLLSVKVILESDPNRPVFGDGFRILRGTVKASKARPAYNRIIYRYNYNSTTGEFGKQETWDNTADQALLSLPVESSPSGAVPKLQTLQLDLRFTSDAETALASVLRKAAFMSIGSFRSKVELPAPEVFDEIDLAQLYGLTTYAGIGPGGWNNAEFLSTDLRENLDRRLTVLEGVLRVPHDFNRITPAISPGFWAVSQGLSAGNLTFERGWFYYNTDDYDQVAGHYVGGIGSSNDPTNSHNVFILDDAGNTKGTLAIPPNVSGTERQLLTPVTWTPLTGGHWYQLRMGDFGANGEGAPEIGPATWAPLIITRQNRGWTKTRLTYDLAGNVEEGPTAPADGGDGEDGTGYVSRAFDFGDSTVQLPDGGQENYNRYRRWYRRDSIWGNKVSEVRYEGVLGWGGLGFGLAVSQSFMGIMDAEGLFGVGLVSRKGDVAEDPIDHDIVLHAEGQLPNLKSYHTSLWRNHAATNIRAKGYKSQIHVCLANVSGGVAIEIPYTICRTWVPSGNSVMPNRRQVLDLDGAIGVYLEADGTGIGTYNFYVWNFGSSNSGTTGTRIPQSAISFGTTTGRVYDRSANILPYVSNLDRVGIEFEGPGTGVITGCANIVIVKGSVAVDDVLPPHEGYNFRRTLTIDQTYVPSDQSDFTVKVDIPADDLLRSLANGGNVQNLDGAFPADLGFFSNSSLTTALQFEIETYNAATGRLLAWVKIPALSGSVNTLFYMGYGDALVTTSPQSPTNAWASHWKAIIHNPATGIDSTGNNNDLSLVGGSVQPSTVAGLVGDAGSFDSSASPHTIMTRAANFNFFDRTWTMLVKGTTFAEASGYNGVMLCTGATESQQIDVKNTGKLRIASHTSGAQIHQDGTGTAVLVTGTWYHLGLAGSSTAFPCTLKGYVNGVLDLSGSENADLTQSGDNTYVGSTGGAVNDWNGLIDELRVSNAELTADYLLTESNSLKEAAFLSVGAEVGI